MTSEASLAEFELSESDLCWLRDTSAPGANADLNPIAWRALGFKYGFRWKTARPAPGKGPGVLLAQALTRS
jgi:hypothetical protein